MRDSQLKDRVVAAIGDEFDVGDELGRGGMSVVFRARDLRLMREVAIKVLPPEFAYDAGVRERFMREAQTAAQLNHPNIVPIFSVDDRGGIVYFAMALCEGESLAVRLARLKRPPIDEVRRILTDVSAALAYAHGRGVVHRDIKPDNILIEKDSGRALVTDFGIARAAEGGTRLTVTGIAMGTPAYMSPEQALGELELDGRSDLYSLGAVAYQMVTGSAPFTASNAPSLLLKHVSEAPVPVRVRRPDAPMEMAMLIDRALYKNREQRWQGAAEMHAALITPTRIESQVRTDIGASNRLSVDSGTDRHEAPASADITDENTPIVNKRIGELRRLVRAIAICLLIIFLLGSGAMDFAVNVPLFASWLIAIISFSSALLLAVTVSLRKRGVSFWSALRSRRRVSFVLPKRTSLRKLEDPRLTEVMRGSTGALIRSAMRELEAIERGVRELPATDRKMLPDILTTVKALYDRVVRLAPVLHDLDRDVRHEDLIALDRRMAALANTSGSNAMNERTLQLLERQRSTISDLINRRDVLRSQVESAVLLMQNIRLDVMKVGSLGVEASIGQVNSATQQARVLSREIGHVLSAAEDLRGI